MNNLTKGKISTTLLKFAFPFLVASLLQSLYGAADLFVVGRFANSSCVSAVAIGSQVMHTVTGIILGISTGGTVLIAKFIGEKNNEKTATAIGSLSILLSLLAVIITPLMLLVTNKAIGLMHTPLEAMDFTRQYIIICTLGIPFIIGYNAVSAIFRGMGDSKTPVYFVLIACIVNIIIDFILVGIFNFGAAGAAFATITSQGISFMLALIYMIKKGFKFEINKSHFKFDKASIKSILIVGCPLALQDALVNVSFLIITAIINTMGLVASAAVGVVEKIIAFAMLPPIAFSSAVSAMTAQNIGAKEFSRAKKVLKYGISFSLIFGVIATIYCQISPQSLTSIFSNDVEVISVASDYLKSFSIDCILVSFVFCMNGYFSGMGKSIISLIHSMIATFAFRIPLSYFISNASGSTIYEIGFAAPISTFVSLLICTGYFIWKNKKDKLRDISYENKIVS